MPKRFFVVLMTLGLMVSCSSDDSDDVDPNVPGDPGATIDNPTTFVFQRNGESTVSFDGQTTRILMSEEIIDKLTDELTTAQVLEDMFAHQEGANDFTDTDLNASDKSVRSKVAASFDFFTSNATDQALIRTDFENWIRTQVDEVFPNWNVAAEAGVAGQIADGSSTRYITEQGLEMNQVFNKSLIGALMVDQILNNYTSSNLLDSFEAANDAETLVEGKNYTCLLYTSDAADE